MQRRLLLALCATAPWAHAAGPRTITWDDLVPPGWDPFKDQKTKDYSKLDDSSAMGLLAMRRLREVFDNAPLVTALDNTAVRLPGYVVPLEEADGALKEFLLVPYFGACIHTPPPPANQIVHVVMRQPAKGLRSMDTVWASGTLKASRNDSGAGVSGYRLDGGEIQPYRAPARQP